MSKSEEKEFVGALDQGTTSSRFILFNRRGESVAVAQAPHSQIFPEEGFVEHDPEEIWAQTRGVILDALKEGNVKPSQVKAIGVANQRETTVVSGGVDMLKAMLACSW